MQVKGRVRMAPPILNQATCSRLTRSSYLKKKKNHSSCGFAGKVYVSHIVDYLRHTTSRGSEDSGLEELCNMLDPEHKDVSIDLDTYHAVMREWIDDCRNNGYCRQSDF